MTIDKLYIDEEHNFNWCDKCGRKIELENWGEFDFCEDCAEEIKEREQDPREDTVFEIENRVGLMAYRVLKEGTILIKNYWKEELDELDIEISLEHEIIHKVLHKIIGLRATYQFDNLTWMSPREREKYREEKEVRPR